MLNEVGAGFQLLAAHMETNRAQGRAGCSQPDAALRSGADEAEGPGQSSAHTTGAPAGCAVKGKGKASPRALQLPGWGGAGQGPRSWLLIVQASEATGHCAQHHSRRAGELTRADKRQLDGSPSTRAGGHRPHC